MPWHDWQFWVVTAAAVLSLWTLLRPFLKRGDANAPNCGSCAAGAAACARPSALGNGRAQPKLVVLGGRKASSER